jgi:hypothetical protein
MKRPRVATSIRGLSKRELEDIHIAAAAVQRAGAAGGTVILPGRHEVFYLARQGDGFELITLPEEKPL